MAVLTVTPTAGPSTPMATVTPTAGHRTPMASVTPTAAPRTPTNTVTPAPTGVGRLPPGPALVPSSVATGSQPPRVAPGATSPPPRCGLLQAAIGSFFGALGGAAVVLFIEWRRRRKDVIDREVESLRRIQFDLSRRLAALDVVRDQWLSPAAKFGGHWVALQPLPGMVFPDAMELEHVGFLLKKNPELLDDLYRADIAFQSYKGLVTDYLASRKEASVAIERSLGAPISEGLLIADVEKHAGQRIDVLLKSMVRQLSERLPQVTTSLEEAFDKVAREIKTSYGEAPLRLADR